MKLNNVILKNLKPQDKPYKKADGKGMHALVMPKASIYFQHRFRFNGKEQMSSFGVYPETSLAEARDTVEENRKKIKSGINPLQEKKAQKALGELNADNTFGQAANEWLELRKSSCSANYHKDVSSRIYQNLFPYF